MSTQADEWPTFEMVTFDPSRGTQGLPADSALFTEGVPKELFAPLYSAAGSLSAVDVAGRGRLACFGVNGSSHLMCLDPSSGEVVEVPRTSGAGPAPVNSSLGQFTESVRAVLARFPFYVADSELEEREAVAEELTATLTSIDSRAFSPDGFWETFIDDLTIGDYSTEDVLSE
jgi:hypothetical protein